MHFTIVGKNIDVTEGLKAAVEEKIGKLERYFASETEVHVTMSVEKLVDKHHNGGSFKEEFLEKDFVDEEEIKIIRTKHFGMKPMYPEDACVQMELLGHNFFVFYNAQTEAVNVVYKRKGNTYGLIEPEY